MEIIKTGLAAFGMSGQVFHAPFIQSNPHFELTKIVERNKELSRERYPQATIVRSFKDLLKDKEIELVVINTPDDTHYEYAKMALKARKHVIVEKPFTKTSKEGRKLIKLAEKKGRMLSVYQNRRWDSDFLTVKSVIDKKLVGRIVEFESTFARYRNFIKPDTWKETGKLGGGLTYNLGSHLIDQAIQLFGKPQAVYAEIDTLRSNGKVDDYFLIRLLRPTFFPSIKITLKASYLMCEPEPRFVLHGTEGSYIKHGTDNQEAALLAGENPEQDGWGSETEDQWGILRTQSEENCFYGKYPSIPGNYQLFYENIYEHLRLRKRLETDAREILPVIKVIEAAFRSQREGKLITIK